MGFNEEYAALRKKRKKDFSATAIERQAEQSLKATSTKSTKKDDDDDIAPVKKTKTTTEEPKKRTWFQGGEFEDGYQFGDVFKTVRNTSADVMENLTAGILGIGESVVDAGAYVAGGVGKLFGADKFADKTKEFIAKDTIDEKKIARVLLTIDNPLGMIGTDTEKGSLFGDKTDSIVQSGGQLVGTVALQSVGVPWFVTTGVTSFGGETENAFNQGASYGEAGASAAITAGAEILTEKLSGGIKFGGKALDDVLTKELTRGISNKAVRTMAKLGMDVVGEGSEEVISQVISNLGTSLYEEENLEDILFSEEALDEYLESFIGGAVLGGVGSGTSAVNSAINGRDSTSRMTANEEKVFQKVYEDRVAEAEEGGKKLNFIEKNKIHEEVIKDMENGRISTDTIESVLGGETYKAYQDTIESEENAIKELETLYEGDELTQAVNDILENSQRTALKQQLSREVSELAMNSKDSFLSESYNEAARRKEAFMADLAKYDTKTQEHIKKAIDSGVLNNTRRTHEFVDMIAKISTDKGVLFDYTNNAKLKESGFAVDGKSVNGFVTKDGVTVNIDSQKALNSIVGHEITHVLEGTEFYDALQETIFEYAKTKGIYDERLKDTYALYKTVDGYKGVEGFKAIKREVVSDLVGDYLFTDTDFINNLSTKNRNVFQKVYDEIKYLCKIATAGSKEARELERVKHAFEQAYRVDQKDSYDADSDTRYSLRVADKETLDFLNNQDTITTYKTMQIVDGKLYPPMAARTEGKYEDYSVLGEWEQATEHPELIRDGNKYKLDKGKGNGSLEAAYNPYMHSSNLVLNDQFTGAYKRNNLVTIECEVPVSELTSGYHAEHAKDSVGWHPWHTGTVAGSLRKAKGTERQVFLSRWIKPVRIVPDSEVAAMYKDLLDGTDVEVPDNVVTPSLLNELKKAGVKVKESGMVKYSLSDSDGKQLTKEQQDYFKDSKMRDENGNLKVMYHGSQDAGFHTFDSQFSDDETSFFFVDRNDVAASYSGTTETYEAHTIRTADDMNRFIESIDAEGYEVVEKGGKFTLLYEGERVADSNTAQGIYDEFCWYEGVGEGDANYKVYLNLTNPLEVDAEGRNWNNISREFSQEVADRYNSLTAEEKAALTDLAEWGEYGIFRDEILSMAKAKADGGDVSADLASAYEKLGGANANLYDAFSIASDNFSDESINQFAVKQMNTRDYAKKAKAEGYDGVIFKNIHDNGGYSNGSEGASTVAIAFDSNQIKSVANNKPTTDNDIRFSLSRNSELMQNAENVNSKNLGIDLSTARQQRQAIYEYMTENADRLKLPEDIEGNTAIKNSSYDITEENTTVCIRSMAADALCDAVAEELGRPLTVQDTLRISQDLMNYTDEPECVYCYVATDRKAYREFLGSYHKQMQSVIDELQSGKNSDDVYKAFLDGRKDTKNMRNRFAMWEKIANGGKMISAKDLASEKMMQNAMRDPELAAQVKDARAYAQSASWAKKRMGYQAYDGHILDWSQRRINDLNKHYGLRFYSFSDFSPAFVLENMQQMTDASVRGLKGLAYTKVLDFAEIFAPTGININISVFGYDQNGVVAQDGMMGADWNGAQDLRNRYENVGITFVATNDTQIEWALNQDWIDVVIPYHLVRTGQAVAKNFGYTNYTAESGDAKGANWKKGDKKTIYPSEHNNDKQTYLAALAEANLEPRFARWVNHPNYMKLVNETRRSANETPPMKAEFNVDAAKESLDRMMKRGGYFVPIGGDYANMQDIASEIADDIRGGKSYSLSAKGEAPKSYGKYNVYGKDVRLETDIAPSGVNAGVNDAKTDTNMFPDDFAPMTEEEAAEMQNERLDSISDLDAPPEVDAPYYEENETATPDDPFESRDIEDVGNQKVKAYMYENPEVKPFFQEEANVMLGELQRTTKGERWYNDKLYYETNGERGFFGTQRDTSADIAYLLDEQGYTYAEIEKGLKAIIEDNGKENNACSKRIEFLLNDRLLKGYQAMDGTAIPADENYKRLLKDKQIMEYNDEARKKFFEVADDFAPYVEMSEESKTEQKTERKRFRPEREKAADNSADEKIAKVLVDEPETPKKKGRTISQLVGDFVDKGAPVEKLALKTKNRELQAKYNFMHYSENRAQHYIKKNLMPLLDKIEKTGKTQEVFDYAYHLHNIDRMSIDTEENKAKREELRGKYFDGMTDKQIEATANQWITKKTTKEDAERIKAAREYVDANVTKNLPVFGDSVTADKSREIVKQYEANNPEFIEIEKEILKYNEGLRKLLVDNGVISQETSDMLAKKYPHYVPTRRVKYEGASISVPLDSRKTGVNTPIKRATGGNSDIGNLGKTMAMRTEQIFKAIARNNFGLELMHTLDSDSVKNDASFDDIMDTIDNQDELMNNGELLKKGENGKAPTFTVFENGKRVEFEITEELFDSMKPTSEKLAKALPTSKLVNAFKKLTTQYNLKFAASNPIKDIQDVLVNSQHPIETYANILPAAKEYIFKGKYYTERLENGGEQDTYFDAETKTFKDESIAKKVVLGIPRGISAVNDFFETTTRLAEYMASRKKGASIETAMLDSARVTTNFNAGGDVTKYIGRNFAPFLNPSVQGAVQQVRNVREAAAEGFTGMLKLAGKYAAASIPVLIFNALAWDDDEEYEELSDYVKENYYVVAKFDDGKFVRIPKGRTLSVLQSAVEQTINAIKGEEFDFGKTGKLFVSNVAPNNPLESNIFSTIKQIKTNKTWYGEDLVPSRLQDMPAAEQYDESTDLISKWLGEKLNVSPYQINYLIDQYSGGIGDMILPMLTPEAESGDNSIGGNLVAPWKDLFTTDSVMNNQNVSDFYDTVDELTKNANSAYATDEDILMSKYMNSVNAELGELYAQKREIQSKRLSDADKYAAVRDIQKQIDAITRESLNTYNNVDIDDGYATVGDLHYRTNKDGEWEKITDKQLEKQEKVTRGLGISASDYWSNKEEYDYAYDYPEKYAVAKSVGGYSAYKTYSSELYDIKADKDENGKSISGSRKEKVIEYVNNLDADYGEKIILFKSEYNADDTYNYEIIDYLNSRQDISYEEMETILKELGFTVDKNGNISW